MQKEIKNGIAGGQILFTDETLIKLGAFINDSIRLSKENSQKLKKKKKKLLSL